MNENNELNIRVLTEELEKYFVNHSYGDLSRLIIKRIPKTYYHRLMMVLNRKNDE